MHLIKKLKTKVKNMQNKNILIAKKTLAFLETKNWKQISVFKILGKQKNITIRDTNDLFININRYFDYIQKKNLKFLEKSSKKDMLFEVLMARLDILNEHRKSVKNIIKFFFANPIKKIKLLPSFIETIILISTLSDIDIDGIKGVPKIKVIFILYIIIIYTWHKDETESLEKTMTTLDKYLNNLAKFINLN